MNLKSMAWLTNWFCMIIIDIYSSPEQTHTSFPIRWVTCTGHTVWTIIFQRFCAMMYKNAQHRSLCALVTSCKQFMLAWVVLFWRNLFPCDYNMFVPCKVIMCVPQQSELVLQLQFRSIKVWNNYPCSNNKANIAQRYCFGLPHASSKFPNSFLISIVSAVVRCFQMLA